MLRELQYSRNGLRSADKRRNINSIHVRVQVPFACPERAHMGRCGYREYAGELDTVGCVYRGVAGDDMMHQQEEGRFWDVRSWWALRVLDILYA